MKITIGGWACPMVNCTEEDMHVHDCCDGCGAMDHMNFGCVTCRAYWEENDEDGYVASIFKMFHEAWTEAVKKVLEYEQNVQD